jgi:hypothetical protein
VSTYTKKVKLIAKNVTENTDRKGNPYKTLALQLEYPNGSTKLKKVLTYDMALYTTLDKLAIGTEFDGEFDADDYHKLVAVANIISAGSPAQQGSPAQAPPQQQIAAAAPVAVEDKPSEEEVRLSCMDLAVDMQKSLMARDGTYKKSIKPDLLRYELYLMADAILKWIKGEADMEGYNSTADDLEKTPADLNQPNVSEDDDEDVPY